MKRKRQTKAEIRRELRYELIVDILMRMAATSTAQVVRRLRAEVKNKYFSQLDDGDVWLGIVDDKSGVLVDAKLTTGAKGGRLVTWTEGSEEQSAYIDPWNGRYLTTLNEEGHRIFTDKSEAKHYVDMCETGTPFVRWTTPTPLILREFNHRVCPAFHKKKRAKSAK